jgi:hypothetical protein
MAGDQGGEWKQLRQIFHFLSLKLILDLKNKEIEKAFQM